MEMIGYALGVLLFGVIWVITFSIVDRATPALIPPLDHDVCYICNDHCQVWIKLAYRKRHRQNKRGKIKSGFFYKKTYIAKGFTRDFENSIDAPFDLFEEAENFALEWISLNTPKGVANGIGKIR